ncbi:flagellar biosynthesis protein FlgL [bacterium]|nr:flagellar biosynthesis protein FlgL [bacterium]
MQTFSVGDMAQSLILSRQGANLKSAMQTLSTEATTGLVSDQTARLKGNYVPIAGIESSLTQLAAYGSVTSETQVITSVMQVALGTISDQSSTLGAAMLAGASSNSTTVVDSLGADAAHKLETVMSALNTRFGDRSVFSGVKSDQSAVTNADNLLTALQGAITASGAISSSEVETAVNTWFDDPNGYAAQVYSGGDPLAPVAIGPGQTAQVDVTAKDPAIISTLKGLALGALLSRGVLQGSDASRADLAKRSGQALSGSQTILAELGARLGTTEATIQNAATRNDAEKSALETARLNLMSVDPYETASKFQETQGQLQTLYTLTARASRLSLVSFL